MKALLPLLTKHGIGWIRSTFYYMSHECELEAKSKTLIEHVKEHKDPKVLPNTTFEAHFGSISSVVFRLFKHKL